MAKILHLTILLKSHCLVVSLQPWFMNIDQESSTSTPQCLTFFYRIRHQFSPYTTPAIFWQYRHRAEIELSIYSLVFYCLQVFWIHIVPQL